VTEWWGKEITRSAEEAPLGGHLAEGSYRGNRPSKGRFCIFLVRVMPVKLKVVR